MFYSAAEMFALSGLQFRQGMVVAKKVARKKATQDASLYVPPATVDIGRATSVAIKKSDSQDVMFQLADGTKLLVKVILTKVQRSLNKYNASGEPVYQAQAAVLVTTQVKKSLMRKIKP